MPKIPSQGAPPPPSASAAAKSYENTLKRNQACHQCRKRKLKCDAKRPHCGTCIRSHAYAARLAHPDTISPLECTFDDFPTSLTVYDPPSSASAAASQGPPVTNAPPAHHNPVPEAGPSTSRDPNDARFERMEARLSSLEALIRSSLTAGNGFGHPKAPQLGGIRSPSVAEYYTPSSLVPQTPVPGEQLPGPSTITSSSFHRGEHPSPYRNEYSAYRNESSSFRSSDPYRRHDSDIEMARYDDSRYPAPPAAASSTSSFPAYPPPSSASSTLPPLPPSSSRDHISITHQGTSLGITTTARIESPLPFSQPTPTVTGGSSSRGGSRDTPASSATSPPFVGTALMDSAGYLPMVVDLPASGVAEVLPDLPVLHPAWPMYLPPPALLNHLVDTFFACVPHAGKLLHRVRFMDDLAQSPTSPRFPLPALLHAICAMASLYTSVIEGPNLPPIEEVQTEERFNLDFKQIRPNQGFGETHAVWASQECVRSMERAGSMIQIMQGFVVLAWYYYTAGSSVNEWIVIGRACRMSAALGILTAEPFGSLDQIKSNPFSVSPPKNTTEREERRNLTWLMYAVARLSAVQTGWAPLLDDADISQFLPLSDEDFITGRDHPFEVRQRLASPNCLFSHPQMITSPFSVMTKAINLVARVKAFNTRFKNLYADDASKSGDPRSTDEFQELDDSIERFKASLPKEYHSRGIKEDGRVDPTMYLTTMLPSVATILLHDPHADMTSAGCPSVPKVRAAVDWIMESIYQITNTSYDIMLLDHYSSFCWFVAGAALIRSLKARIGAGAVVDVIKINSEIEIVRHILLKLSEKTMIGRRLLKLLNDLYDRESGVQRPAIEEATPSPITASESSTSVTSSRNKLKVSDLLNFTSTVPEVRPPRVGSFVDASPQRPL